MKITDDQQAIYNLKKAEKILEDNEILENSQKTKITNKIKDHGGQGQGQGQGGN